MKRALFYAASVALLAAPLPAYADPHLLQLVCTGKTTSKNANNRKFRKSIYVDLTASTYCEDICGVIRPLSARTQDTVEFGWAPQPDDGFLNNVYRDLTFNWRTKKMTGHMSVHLAYHEEYDIAATCEVLQVEFRPVIKFFDDARKATDAR